MLWVAARDPRISQGSEAHRRLCWAVCLIWWELAYPYWYDYAETTGYRRPERAMEALEAWLNGKIGAAEAAEAAGAARAAGAASLERIAEIVREVCLEPEP